ncbi:MAG TPA: glycosyltransferase family 87 protein [Terriglobia bacterium]|nr:glycosyltransferase family 87 protein [Terriglobia bacterium]
MKKGNQHPFLFAFFSFLLLFHLMLFWHAKDDALKGSADFSAFYSAVRMVRSGQGPQLYDIAAQGRMQSVLYPKVTTRSGTLIYDHPPFEALLYLPLAYVSYAAAYIIWIVFSVLILLLTVRLLSPYMAELKTAWTPLPVLIFLGFFPVFVDLLHAQDSLLLLLVYALVFVSLKEGHEFRAGCFLAIALFKFQYAMPFLVPFILWRRWKVVGGFAISSGILFLLSLPVAGFRGTLSYAAFLSNLVKGLSSHDVQNALGILSNTMPNIRGAVEMMVSSLLPHSLQKPLIVLLSGMAVLWVVKKWPLGRALSDRNFDLGISLAMVVSILASYHLQLHDLSLLLIAFALVLNRILKNEIFAGRWRLPVYALIALFYLSPIYLLLMRHGLMYLFFWPILLFLVMLSRELMLHANSSPESGYENVADPLAKAT